MSGVGFSLPLPFLDTDCFIALEQNHTAALIACRKVVSGVVKLDSGDDVG